MADNPVLKTIDFLTDKHGISLSIIGISGLILEQFNRQFYSLGQKYDA